MAANTGIEWAHVPGYAGGRTWQPTSGCKIKSSGCTHCYAMKMAARLERMGQPRYTGLTQVVNGNAVWTGEARLNEEALLEPFRWSKPQSVFVDSMADLFYEEVEDEWIDRAFASMALTPQHLYLVLTKRPDRMQRWFGWEGETINRCGMVRNQADWLMPKLARPLDPLRRLFPWPLPNVWLGTSCENQATADERIPHLLRTPAAVRFLSCEPLLSEIDLTQHLLSPVPSGHRCCETGFWVIAGGESGDGARPMHPDWARSLRDQCVAAEVPYFFKQWGCWIEDPDQLPSRFSGDRRCLDRWTPTSGLVYMKRVSKHTAGRVLDGREWNEFPDLTEQLP